MLRVGYARVSTGKQEKSGYSLKEQKARLLAFGIAEEYIYSEAKTAKDTEGRPKFTKILEMVEAGEVSEIVAIHPDRVARNESDWMMMLNEFSSKGVKLTTLENSSDWDVSNSANYFNALVAGGLSTFELLRIKERNGKAWERRKRDKTALNPPFGYQLVKRNGSLAYALNKKPFLCLLNQKAEDCPGMTVADIAADIIDMFFELKSLRGVLRNIHEKYYGSPHSNDFKFYRMYFTWSIRFSVSGLSRWLQDPVLQGHTANERAKNIDNPDGWDIKRDTHPNDVLINELQLEDIKEILKGNKKKQLYTDFVRKNPLSGLVRCAVCNSSCNWNASKPSKRQPEQIHYYYGCKHGTNRTCSNIKFTRIEKIYKHIYLAIKDEYCKALEERADQVLNKLEGGEEEVMQRQGELEQKLAELNSFKEKYGGSVHIEKEIETATREMEHIAAHWERINRLKGANKERVIELAQSLADKLDALLEGVEFSEVFGEVAGGDFKSHLKGLDDAIRRLVQEIWIQDGEVVRVKVKI